MHFSASFVSTLLLALAATLVISVPVAVEFSNEEIAALSAIERRQSGTSDELENDSTCKQVYFIFARGSTESGNMGTVVGPQTCSALKSSLGSSVVGCQGVGSPYEAILANNFLPANTGTDDIGAATTLFNLANTKCPNAMIIAGGYSQGSAVMDGSIQALPAAIQAKVKGVVLFGFTRNAQDDGKIPNYPSAQTKVFCATGDMVCTGTLYITAAHLTYGANAAAAAAFLASNL